MARISKERIEWLDGTANLIPRHVILVNVVSFTFRFRSVEQIEKYLRFFETKIHPSSLIPAKDLEADLGAAWRELRGWEVERCFERLPMYLFEEPKRQKVVKALSRAIELERSGKLKPR
jgi:hypothetical protein